MFGSAIETYRPRKASGSIAEAAAVAASRPPVKASPGSSPWTASNSEPRSMFPNGVTNVSVTVSAAPLTPGIAV